MVHFWDASTTHDMARSVGAGFEYFFLTSCNQSSVALHLGTAQTNMPFKFHIKDGQRWACSSQKWVI